MKNNRPVRSKSVRMCTLFLPVAGANQNIARGCVKAHEMIQEAFMAILGELK